MHTSATLRAVRRPAVHHSLRLSVLCLALAAAHGPLQAQGQDGAAASPSAPAPSTLSAVVVTASGNAQELREAPASVSVITREDLEKRPVQELAELLGTVEGVTLSRSGNLVPGVQLRGLGAAYTLMLIDGKRVNATNAMFRGNDYDTGWVPTDEIERIEIVRGPMSSLYGSDAIGGVVNIITRPVGKQWRGSARVEGVVQQDKDAGDSRLAGFSLAGPVVADTLGIKLTGAYDQRDADGAINSPDASGARQDGLQHIRNRLFGAQLAFTPNSRHSITLDADTSRRDHAGFLMERDAVSLRHKGQWGFGNTELTFAADEIRNLTGMISGQVNPNKANTTSLNGKASIPVAWGNQFITAGFDVRREKLRDPANLRGLPGSAGYDASPETSIGQWALFVEDEIRITDKLAVTLGNRFDHHDNFGGHNSPRAYAVYHLSDAVTLKGGVARAFRAPTLLQGSPNWGSVSCGSATVGCYIVGSNAIKPETGTSQELGLQFASGIHSGSLMFFNTDLKNMIDITSRTADRDLAPSFDNFVGYLPDGRPIFRYQNIASVRSRGLEASWQARASAAWDLRANYTFTDAKNTSGDTPQPLAYRPRHVVNLGADWRATPQLTLSGNLRYNSAQYISVGWNEAKKGGYAIADLTLGWRMTQALTLRAGVLNLGGKTFDRTTSADFNEDGRRYYLALHARF
jgi:outer membrane receptor for ferrienterochelin and colicins